MNIVRGVSSALPLPPAMEFSFESSLVRKPIAATNPTDESDWPCQKAMPPDNDWQIVICLFKEQYHDKRVIITVWESTSSDQEKT